ncbi:hypothetical protein Ade02nite_70850 [Paractinoplanes deccanensis]|uniref:Uncharacterized protein n=1 Tax=Paractinoplanes deccanensis TaxID=113561 RepID=A0ABQ3YEK9_9ACTN|nr:hypothetical protein [Actinoplanes deccanensis]GID78444.1 hypothetical protein Ade02nite_70850 [Actinoplanes deccanensis]
MTTEVRRPTGRRTGYVIAAAVDAALLYVINRWPGWDAVPFLTADTTQVLLAVNLSLVVGVVVNAVWIIHDPRWLTALGGLATTGAGLIALIRIWEVFPFSFTGGFDWALVTRVMLVVGIAGSMIAMIVGLGQLATAFRSKD